jgi:uncharacterized membrane protein YbhN (UPF0104 family)
MSLPIPDGVRRAWPRLRLLGGVVVLAFLLWRFGTGPFVDAWRVTTWSSVAAALAINLGSTLACAWRWRVVARSLGAPLGVRESVTAYYRSQFLNTVLPGGVLGDAHRGVRHGRSAGDLGVGLRATVWDRVSGQVVQAGLLVLTLGLLGTPLARWTPYAVLAALLSAALLVGLARRRGAATTWVGADLRRLLRPAAAGPIALGSLGSSAGHVAVFLLAAHAVGVDASPALLVTVALVVLVGSAVPLNVAGWGPREGVTAWVFAVVGLGSATGLATSLGYGVLGAAATAPGAVVLLGDAWRRRRARGAASPPAPVRPLEEVAHG